MMGVLKIGLTACAAGRAMAPRPPSASLAEPRLAWEGV